MDLKAFWEKDYLLGWKKGEGLSRAPAKKTTSLDSALQGEPLTSMCAFSAHSRQHLVMQEVGLVIDIREALSEGRALGR